MAWSTREIAELAGTSLRAVRHYHEVGLLDEPERRSNGYKQYGVSHLLRLLRIKRLTDLGLSLAQVAGLCEAPDSDADLRDLRALDEELAATIERMRRTRAEIGVLLRAEEARDLPQRFAELAGATGLPAPDRSFLSVLSTVAGPGAMDAYTELLREQAPPVADEFTHLPGDADETTRRRLAERLVPYVQGLWNRNPALSALGAGTPRGQNHATRTLDAAIGDLYNPAQVDVMRRLHKLLSAPGDGR
ncbi:MerR family transcriptional regulator [Streptomyces sp. NPDC049916]|uniref:MerR family transcriptional regulator n=1 Tax=Streptomyces sp. NPDC049916 TaxID=3155156 RepID=UPI00343B8258